MKKGWIEGDELNELAGPETYNPLLRNLNSWNEFNGGGRQPFINSSIQSNKTKKVNFLFNLFDFISSLMKWN